MNVNHEIKSQLAKLLATEDLIVEHKHVETASFNVHDRVLTLPCWETASITSGKSQTQPLEKVSTQPSQAEGFGVS